MVVPRVIRDGRAIVDAHLMHGQNIRGAKQRIVESTTKAA